jgi:predicted XRE-type DNA-binding protein
MSKKTGTTIVHGTNNIFSDIGRPDADTHLLKAELVSRIQDVIAEQKLTQVKASKRMGISQPNVSRLLNGQFRDMSVERLMRLLTKLGCNVDIVIRNPGRSAKSKDTIHVHATPA